MVRVPEARVTTAPVEVVYGLGLKLIDVGAAPKMLAAVVKVPLKLAKAAWRGANAAAGVAELMVAPEPTVRVVFVGKLIVLVGLPTMLKLTVRALASLGASAIEAPTAAAIKGRSLVVFIGDRVAINAVVQRQVSSRIAGKRNW